MNWTPFLFLAIGFLLIFVEFFVPGGILGIAGSVCVVVAIVLFAIQAESGLAVALFIIGSLAAVGVLIRFALWRIKRAKGKQTIYLDSDQEGFVASKYAKELIGKEGEALSDLKPSGHIQVEGERMQAVSKTGYIKKGSKIVVVGGEGAHLEVKLRSSEDEY